MQPKQTLRMLLLSLCIPIALGIRFLAVTGRQPKQIPRWVTAGVLLYFASVFIYTNVYARRHRDELRDAEGLERRKEWAVKHRRGILNTLFISSMAGLIIPLVLFFRGHLDPPHRWVNGYCFVVSAITLALCVRSKLRGFSAPPPSNNSVGKDPRIP
jgi:peptidoglycan/LPS O-acetylase OafA/YrhL